MKVKILKSTSSAYWYSNRIGEIFEVHDSILKTGDYMLLDRSSAIKIVDCVIIDDFVLPKRWYLKNNKQIDHILIKWRGGGYSGDIDEIVLTSDRCWFFVTSMMLNGYTEITFEQFEKYVLNKQEKTNNMNNKKIIGYKCPCDILDNWKKGDIFKPWRDNNNKYHVENKFEILPKELVETWEPVYEDEKIMIGGYEVVFLANGNTVIDEYPFSKEFWRAAKEISHNNKAKIMVGCSKQIDVSLETIVKIYNKIK